MWAASAVMQQMVVKNLDDAVTENAFQQVDLFSYISSVVPKQLQRKFHQ